jgi:hypothetical protein
MLCIEHVADMVSGSIASNGFFYLFFCFFYCFFYSYCFKKLSVLKFFSFLGYYDHKYNKNRHHFKKNLIKKKLYRQNKKNIKTKIKTIK